MGVHQYSNGWSDNDYDASFQDLDVDIIDTLEEAPPDWKKMVILGGIHPDARASDHVARLLFKYFRKKNLLTK